MRNESLKAEQEQMELILGKLLRLGILLSLVFMLLGLGLFLLQAQPEVNLENLSSFKPFAYVGSHSLLDGVTVMLMGVFLLILTPIFRVISTLIIFAKEKDLLYLRFTSLVLVIIIVSIILGFIVEPK